LRNSSTIFTTSCSTRGSANAVAAAHCEIPDAPLVTWVCKADIAFATRMGASATPMRQPVIAYALLAP